jgi:hypothetical protein
LNQRERYEPRLLIANRHRMELIHEAEQNRLAAGAGRGPRLLEQLNAGGHLAMSRIRTRVSAYRSTATPMPCVEPCPECASC